MARALYAGEEQPPQLMAVVELESREVLARAMRPAVAEGFAKSWERIHECETATVIEPIILPSDDQVLALLR